LVTSVKQFSRISPMYTYLYISTRRLIN